MNGFFFQEREAQFENEMENDEFILPGETNKEIGLAALKTIESLKGVRIFRFLSTHSISFGIHRLRVSSKHSTSGEKRNWNLPNTMQQKKH